RVDGEALRVHGGHVVGGLVHQQDVVAGPREAGPGDPADGAGAVDGDGHGAISSLVGAMAHDAAALRRLSNDAPLRASGSCYRAVGPGFSRALGPDTGLSFGHLRRYL